MSVEGSEYKPVENPVPAPRRFDWIRLIMAVAITYGVLIYAWGRTFLEGVMIHRGNPRPKFVWQLVGGIAAVMFCSAGLAKRFQSARVDHWVLRGGTAAWLGGILIASWFVIGDRLPKLLVVPFFALTSLWVVCLAWICYRPWTWRARGSVLGVCLLVQVAFVAAFRVDNIQGEFQVHFDWRSAPAIDHGSDLPTQIARAPETKPAAGFPQTTNHDFPQFLGPDRSAVLTNCNLSSDWSKLPPRELWRIPVGAGWSGFVAVGNFAITQEQRGSKECVVCYRLSDGQPVWLHSDEARFESDMGALGPRATPAIADGLVYTVGGTGILNCLDGATGISLWQTNILEDNGGRNIAHGVCGSPLVIEDLVIVAPTDVEGACLAAYNRRSGERRWQGGTSRASYGSPAIAMLAGRSQVLLVTHDGIEGSDVQTGKPLWSFPWSGDLHVNCSQPVVVDETLGRVFYGTGYGKGSVLLEIAGTGSERCSVREVWRSPGKMKSKFTTAVKLGDFVYGLDDGILACLDLHTGKQLWKGGRYGHGQILLAGDLLIVQSESGDVVLVKPDPQKLIELGNVAALSSKTWNNPALAGKTLIVRNDREAVCYELPERP
jgi:outer membrane protein assembly factor BamB